MAFETSLMLATRICTSFPCPSETNGQYTFAAFEGPGAGVAVIDHEAGNSVIATLPYGGRPHGVDFARP